MFTDFKEAYEQFKILEKVNDEVLVKKFGYSKLKRKILMKKLKEFTYMIKSDIYQSLLS